MADDPNHLSDRDLATRHIPQPRPPIDQLVLGVISVFMSHSIHVDQVAKRADSVEFRDPATGRVYEVIVRPVTFPMDPRD